MVQRDSSSARVIMLGCERRGLALLALSGGSSLVEWAAARVRSGRGAGLLVRRQRLARPQSPASQRAPRTRAVSWLREADKSRQRSNSLFPPTQLLSTLSVRICVDCSVFSDRVTAHAPVKHAKSGTLQVSGPALKRLEELKIGGIDVTTSNMEALRMLRLADVVEKSQPDELANAMTELAIVERASDETESDRASSGDSDSGYDLGGDGDLEDVSSSSLSSRSSVTGGSTESLVLAVSEKQTTKDQQRFAVLSYEQVSRLHDVMNETVLIHGRGNFPTLELRLRDLVTLVRAKLEADGVPVKDIRLNGGAASHVLALERCQPQPYNDLDLIFGVELSSARTYDRIKTAVLESLLDFLPDGVSRTRMHSCSLKEAYVSKMVKVTEDGRWSLISLGTNLRGKNVELKFVHTMRRQFEFSVDSFQIILDSLLLFYDCASTMPISESFYPTVVAESVYGDFREARYHLHHKLIATRSPEEIRGGGLLKYCNLLVKDYRPADPGMIKTLERYMCSRFFIDFPDVAQQRVKLENYLCNHFVGADEYLKHDFLATLYQVVDESTVCLMGHERRQTLSLIDELAYQVYYAEQQHHHHPVIHQVIVPQQPSPAASPSPAPAATSQPGNIFHHAPVYEVRISGCQPTVIYSSTGGYFYAPTSQATPSSSSTGVSVVTTTTAPSTPCYPCSTPCACSCAWMPCS